MSSRERPEAHEGNAPLALSPQWRVVSDPLLRQLLLELGGALSLPGSEDNLFGENAIELFGLQLARAHAQTGGQPPIRRGGLAPVALRRTLARTHGKERRVRGS